MCVSYTLIYNSVTTENAFLSYRPEEKFHGIDSSAKCNKPGYLRARFNHSSSNIDQRNCAVLPTLPSVQASNLQHSLSLLNLQDSVNSRFHSEHYISGCGNESAITCAIGEGDNCINEGTNCKSSGERAMHSDLAFGNKSSVDSGSHHGDFYKSISLQSQYSRAQNCRMCVGKCSDDDGRISHGSCTGMCCYQTSDNTQNNVFTSGSLCQNHATKLNKEREEAVKVLQNSESVSKVTSNCLIRTHSSENLTRNSSQCSRSNCNCSVDSVLPIQMQLHTVNCEQYQKCSQKGCCRKICEHARNIDTVNVKHLSALNCMCGAHNDVKGQDCKGRNSSHRAHPLDNFPLPQHSIDKHCQGLNSHSTLQESGCHRSLNDGNICRAVCDEVFKEHGSGCTKQAAPAKNVKEATGGCTELMTSANCGTHSPLSSLRLQPTRHRTKSAILSILESGEVCIEFLRKRNGSREEKVVDVCRISSDGLRVRNI